MDKVSICHACGRTVESAFVFCPWCGTAADSLSLLSAHIDSVVEAVSTLQKAGTASRFSRMENELGEIDEALSAFLSISNHI